MKERSLLLVFLLSFLVCTLVLTPLLISSLPFHINSYFSFLLQYSRGCIFSLILSGSGSGSCAGDGKVTTPGDQGTCA